VKAHELLVTIAGVNLSTGSMPGMIFIPDVNAQSDWRIRFEPNVSIRSFVLMAKSGA
jgi:hypothetical protein